MTSNEKTVEGASTDQHVSLGGEEGAFQTDLPPTSSTPAGGSSNKGINKLHANREDVEEELDRELD